jgi:hypothetical protein
LSARARSRRASAGALLALAALAAGAACELLIDVGSLDNGQCPAGEKPCPGENRCVRVDAPNTGCGSESCAPCTFPHATATCEAGVCHRSACIGRYDDCDGVDSNGCETDLDHDPANCGTCHHACDKPPNGFPGCSGACVIGGCDVGFSDCDGVLVNGCETAGVCQ